MDGCVACDLAEGRLELPGGTIHETPLFLVEHCVGPLGVGTLLVKPRRHVTRTGELTEDEAVELGRLLQRAAQVVDELVGPEQVYTCQWSHAGRVPVHVHWVVMPATTEAIDGHGGAFGPMLQTAMFAERAELDREAVDAFCDRARAVF